MGIRKGRREGGEGLVDSSVGSRELLPGHEGVAGGMSRGNGPGGPYVPQRRFKDRGPTRTTYHVLLYQNQLVYL